MKRNASKEKKTSGLPKQERGSKHINLGDTPRVGTKQTPSAMDQSLRWSLGAFTRHPKPRRSSSSRFPAKKKKRITAHKAAKGLHAPEQILGRPMSECGGCFVPCCCAFPRPSTQNPPNRRGVYRGVEVVGEVAPLCRRNSP